MSAEAFFSSLSAASQDFVPEASSHAPPGSKSLGWHLVVVPPESPAVALSFDDLSALCRYLSENPPAPLEQRFQFEGSRLHYLHESGPRLLLPDGKTVPLKASPAVVVLPRDDGLILQPGDSLESVKVRGPSARPPVATAATDNAEDEEPAEDDADVPPDDYDYDASEESDDTAG